MTTSWQLLVAAGLLSLGSLGQAGLISYTVNGVDLVYDDDYTPVGSSNPGLTWTANANLAKSETFGVGGIGFDGEMSWLVAQEWIGAMNTANYGGANDWRLWSALDSDGSDPCTGLDCTDSELGHLFYIEGGLSSGDAINDSTMLTDVFTNMDNTGYWSGTPSAPDPGWVWILATDEGSQYVVPEDDVGNVWAVRSGQVVATPLPGTTLLMALGMSGLLVFQKRLIRG